MWFDILVYVAAIGAPILAVWSVYRRIKNTDPNVAGYIYNGKKWVTWLLLICIIAALFIGFIMPIPIISGSSSYHPEWGVLGLMLIAILMYICYSLIAYVPATAQEVEESKAAGNSVMGTVGETTASMFKVILSMIGAILLALPGMIKEVLNPTLAFKTIGNTVYRIVGTGFVHVVIGIVVLAFLAILVFMLIYLASLVFALIGTFAMGIIAIAKFVINNFILPKKKQAANP
jgi:hypothetical protein